MDFKKNFLMYCFFGILPSNCTYCLPQESLVYPLRQAQTNNINIKLILHKWPLRKMFLGHPCVPHGHRGRLILLILNLYYINELQKTLCFYVFFKILLHKGTYCYTLGSPCVPQKTQGGTNTIITKQVLRKRILRRNFG